MKTASGKKMLFVVVVVLVLCNFNVAKGASFGTPYLRGETIIAINQQNYPTKLIAEPASGGVITAIIPSNNVGEVAYYLVRGNTLYVTGFHPGTVTFQVEETMSNTHKVLSAPATLTFYQVNIRTQTTCESYDPTSRTLAVSPVNPLHLLVDTGLTITRPELKATLQNPSLGDVQMIADSSGRTWLQVVYQSSGSTTLTVLDKNNITVIALSTDFLPVKTVSLNLYHVRDSKGNQSFRLDQQAMIAYMQSAEKILNQSGITLHINDQRDILVPTNLGSTIEAYSEGQSAEEQAVLSSAPPEARAASVSIFLVWGYQIQHENTIGINYSDDTLGQVIFLSEKSSRPGETLAHEIGHALGLNHSVLGSGYLMSPAEVSTGNQCLITRQERLTMNAL